MRTILAIIGGIVIVIWLLSQCGVSGGSVDICPNLPGPQITVPSGYNLINGQCVPQSGGNPPTPATPVAGQPAQPQPGNTPSSGNNGGQTGGQIVLEPSGWIRAYNTPDGYTATFTAPKTGTYRFEGVNARLLEGSDELASAVPGANVQLTAGRQYTVIGGKNNGGFALIPQ